MSFKDNLLKKIRIDTLAGDVLKSLGSPDSGKKLDKNAMQRLLEMRGFHHQKERDLDLYVEAENGEPQRILVLGNEMAFFRSTIHDVAMRRSPTVKEMISIRNAVKILNDKDIVITKGADTLGLIRQECLDMLDLSFDASDLDDIAADGCASLKNSYADGVIEALTLFAELLPYQNPPRALQMSHHRMFGRMVPAEAGGDRFGPLVVYSLVHNELKFIDESFSVSNRDDIQRMESIVKGRTEALCAGPEVFHELKRRVMKDR